MQRKCIFCGVELVEGENICPSHIRYHIWKCNSCDNAKNKARRQKNPEKHRQYMRAFNRRLKTKLISHYSNGTMQCAKCGFADIRALSIDHIGGDGCDHKRSLGSRSPYKIYYWLINNGFPEGYQVLCMNCQFIKRHENNEFRPHLGLRGRYAHSSESPKKA